MRRREGWNEWKRRELIGRRKQTEREKEDGCFLLDYYYTIASKWKEEGEGVVQAEGGREEEREGGVWIMLLLLLLSRFARYC